MQGNTKRLSNDIAWKLFIHLITIDTSHVVEYLGRAVLKPKTPFEDVHTKGTSNINEIIRVILDFFIQKFHEHKKHKTLTSK